MNIRNFTRLTLSLFLSIALGAGALAQNAFYTEDFGGGFPSDWTSVEVLGNGQPSAVWVYTTEGPQGPQFGIDPVNSTTAANGWMMFDSDVNCNFNVGQDAWLISPAIDASGQAEVWIQFETFYRSFNDRPQIRVGTNLNDLDSWATIEVFPGISANDFGGILLGNEGLNPQVVNLDLTAFAAGVNGLHFAFQFLSTSDTENGGNGIGCAYAWEVDDVKLLDANPTPRHNLIVSAPRLPNYAQPYTQTDTVRFAAIIENRGQLDQTGVSITAEIMGNNVPGFSSTESTDLLEVDSSVLFLMDESFLPSATVTNYLLTYTIAADSTDEQPENNVIERVFEVSEDLFQKDYPDDGFFTTQPAEVEGDTWEVGNYYLVPNGGFEAYQAEFSIASDNNTHQGQSVNVFLYEINEDDDPANFTDEDVVLLGFATHTFTNEANGDLITVTLTDLLTAEEGVELQEGGEYLLMVEYLPDMRALFSDTPYDYDVATVVNDGGWFLLGFGSGVTAVARMRIRSVETSIGAVEIAKADIQLFPNPVTDALSANIELENASKQMEVRVLNANGQTVLSQTFDNTKGENVRFDVRQFATGTYFLQIRTDEGVKTERFAVQR